MHRLLERQIKRALGVDAQQWGDLVAQLQAQSAGQEPGLTRVLSNLSTLLDRVSESYAQHERDIALVRRSLELSSDELTQANQRLLHEAKASNQALLALQQAIAGASPDDASAAHGGLVAMAEQVAALTREQERMRQALSQSEERFDLAMRGANDGLWDYDLINSTVYFSPRWKEMIGESEQDVGNSPEEWRSRLHPNDFLKAMNALQAHLSGSTPLFETVFRFRHRRGHYLWILSRGLAVRNEEGKAVRVVGTHTDITQRVELERYLAQFKAAIDEHAIVSITDVKGNITYANQKFCNISGYSVEEVLGKNHRLVKSGKHPDSFYKGIWQVISNGHTWTGEICNRAKDGGYYWVLATIAPMLDDNGLPYQYIGIRADITRSKLHEAELRQAKEAAEMASKTKSEFLANMSHEIRTPMNGVLGMIDLAMDTPLNEEQKEYLELAQSSANSLLTVLNDILDFSKIEAGRLDVHPEPMDPRPLAEELARLNEPRCRERSLRFVLDIAPDIPSRILADPTRVRQVLVNLLSNALKFTAEGVITLSLRGMVVEGQESVRFIVRDSGIGISHEKQASVFEAFTQADGSITKRFGGTGLGLTISNRLVKLMGGRMGLHSELGRGSEFFFSLPVVVPLQVAQEKPLSPDASAAAPTHHVAGLRILLAEDNAINQKLAISLLARVGHVIEVVEDGAAAVAAVAAAQAVAPFDLVLMDMHMPGLDGLQATQEIRALPAPASHIPVIALTANAFPEDKARCLAVGMNAYVAKPIRLNELLAAIDEALGQQ